jgi:multidrug efflux pump subunit AcrB
MAVVFAMLASYLLSRTLVPTMASFLLKHELEMLCSGDSYVVLIGSDQADTGQCS